MKIILNNDDFGISRGVNYGVIDAYNYKTLTSTTMIVNAPESEHAAKLYKNNPGLGVGLHFNLTMFKPLTNISCLMDETGTFFEKSNIFGGTLNLNLDEIKKELEAQFLQFIKLTAVKPTHIDSHHHVHLLEGIKQLVVELANEHEIPVRDLKTNSRPIGFSCHFYDNPTFEDFRFGLQEAIKQGQDEIEYSCHIGYIDEVLVNATSYNYQRSKELELYLSEELKSYLSQFELTHY